MRWLVTIVYLALILVGFWLIHDRYETSRGGSGGLLRDIGPTAGLVYAKHDIHAGESVSSEDLGNFPALTWPDGQVLVTVPTDRKQIDSGEVNGGKQALLCGGTFSEKVPVQAVMCGPKNTSCIAIVTFAAAKLQSLGDALKPAGTRLSLRPSNAANCS